MWYTATSASVSVTTNPTIVSIATGDDISIIQEDSGLIFEGESPVQVKRGYIDGSGNKFIELQSPWPYSTKTNQPLIAYPTDADFAAATAELRRVIDTLSVASTVEAQTGTDDEKIMTSLKTKQAIDFNTGTAASKDVVSSVVDTTTGRLLTVGYMGLGATTQPEIGDLDDVSIAGFYPVRAGSTLNNPLNTYHSSVLRMNSPFLGRGSEILVTNSSGDVRALIRGEFGGVSSEWQELYHSGNTNFNEFGGLAEGDILCQGYAQSSSLALFLLPINSYKAVASITVTGSFRVERQGGVSLGTVSGSSVFIIGSSTSRVCVLAADGISGANLNENLILKTVDATSKIKANF